MANASSGGAFEATADYVVTGDWIFEGDATFNGTTVETGTALALTDTTNQIATGAGSNITTSNYPASSGAVTLTFPNVSTTIVGTTTTNTLTNKTLTAPALTSPVITTGTVTTSLVPTTNDGAPLGDTTHQFSDLFLAEGGVINWDNGDATLTQASNMVTLAGADLTVANLVASGDVKAATFHAGATAGITAGPFTTVASINVIAGIVTTLTGS